MGKQDVNLDVACVLHPDGKTGWRAGCHVGDYGIDMRSDTYAEPVDVVMIRALAQADPPQPLDLAEAVEVVWPGWRAALEDAAPAGFDLLDRWMDRLTAYPFPGV